MPGLGRVTRRRRIAPALVLSAALAGCSTVASLNPFAGESSASNSPSAAPVASCPTAAVLRPLAQTAVFAPRGARQPGGVAFYGLLSDVDVKCQRSGGATRVSLDVVVIGERGPATGSGDSVDLQYFIAVTGPDQAILSKRSLPVRIVFPADGRRAGVTDHVEQLLPPAPPGELNIMLGFQQSSEVVEFYKRFRGR